MPSLKRKTRSTAAGDATAGSRFRLLRPGALSPEWQTADVPLRRRVIPRSLHVTLFVAVTLWSAACTSLRVPRSIPDPGGGPSSSVKAMGVSVSVRPIVGRESYWELFDEDLPEMGMAAAWVTIRNGRQDEVSVEPARWYLRSGTQRSPRLSPEEVMGRYYKARKIRMYSVRADREARRRLDDIGLQQGRLSSAGIAEGLVFFRIAVPANPRWHEDKHLIVRGLFSGRELREGIEVPLYADR